MKISFVEIAGFRGFRDTMRLDFANGFVVLTGRNGAGKSTVLDAIDFAFTGSIHKFAVTEAKGEGLRTTYGGSVTERRRVTSSQSVLSMAMERNSKLLEAGNVDIRCYWRRLVKGCWYRTDK
jgi:recombinational DNA repair ATPase RecF